MSRFEYCLQKVLGHEGGYADVKSDRGGKTNYGVTQRTYSEYLKLVGKPDLPVKEIQVSEVEAIYSMYWREAHCSYMPEPLDLLMLDASIHHGAKRAIKLLQQALGVDADGVAGRETMEALHEEMVAGDPKELCTQYLELRKVFLDQIIYNDPSQEAFRKGWMNRVDHLIDLVEGA